MARERWRNIEDYPHYRVSSAGRVKNRTTGHVLKPSMDRHGYLQVILCGNGPKRANRIHRLVAKEFVDGYENNLQVNHIDGNKRNNRVENLEWVTPSENTLHAYELGLSRKSPIAGKPKRRVLVVENGDIFESESECARALGVKREGINACLNGRSKTYYGFHYEFVD